MRESLISSVVDVGCGDWQFSKNIDLAIFTTQAMM